MKNNLLPLGLALLLFLQSCTKHGLSTIPGNTVDFCSIHSLTFPGDSPDTVTFVYDALGRPIRGDRAFIGDDAPRYLFRYDDQGRLKDFIGAYDNGAAEYWTRYTYDDDRRTAYDTTYTLAAEYISWPPRFYGFEEGAVKKYDALGRIVSRTSFILAPINGVDSVFESTQDFIYDRQGNVEGQGQYDNKVNLHRTNRVWQFIDDQFSTNNPYLAQQYNSHDLPTEINFTGDNSPGFNVLFNINYFQTVVHYNCDLSGGPSPRKGW